MSATQVSFSESVLLPDQQGEVDNFSSAQDELAVAKETIDNLDLTPIIERLVKVEGWKRYEVLNAIRQYRNYLFLRKKYPNEILPPSVDIDEIWHAHILHTKNYREFCKAVFYDREDSYLDHHPSFTTESLDKTQALYVREFGSKLYQAMWKSRWAKLFDIIKFNIFRF